VQEVSTNPKPMHASLKLADDPLEFDKLGSPILDTERPVRREAPEKNESDRTSYSNDEFVESDRNKTGKVQGQGHVKVDLVP